MVSRICPDSRACEIHAPKFTQKFTLDSEIHENVKFARISYEFVRNSYEFRTNFVRIYPPFHSFALLQLSKPSRSSLLTMSQQTMSQLASLASRPDPAADTLANYQALPVAHHQLEEATYESEALGVDDIVGWAVSLDPSPDVIHIDMRSPTRNSHLGGRGWATTLWRELRHQLPTLKFLHLTPLPSSVDQLLNSMRNDPVGKPKLS